MNTLAVIAAAGSGTRFGGEINKLFHQIDGRFLLQVTLDAFCRHDGISEIAVVYSPTDKDFISQLQFHGKPHRFIEGGSTRTESVKNALLSETDCEIVLIHDGARPFVSQKLISDCIACVKKHGSGIPAIAVHDTLKRVKDKCTTEQVNRDSLYRIQTPQGFLLKNIKKAYENLMESFTDDSTVYEKSFGSCAIFEGETENIKITEKSDLKHFDKPSNLRTGYGYDIHQLVTDRKLLLGGVEIPSPLGLLGHSDADVLIHAVMDSLLSAVGERDIGFHFPNSEEKFRNISSLLLLYEVEKILFQKGARVQNLSCSIVCEKPKLSPYLGQMKENIAKVLGILPAQIGITVTTNEGLGSLGRSEGICAVCSSLVSLSKNDGWFL